MSSSLTERTERTERAEDGRDRAAMETSADEDVTDLSMADGESVGSGHDADQTNKTDNADDDDDSKTIRGDDAALDSPDLVSMDGGSSQPPAVLAPSNGTTLGSRYRGLVQDQQQQDTMSEDGSALGLPRRPGSPSGSVLSVSESTTSTAQRSGISSFGGSSIFPSGSSTRSGFRGSSPSFRPFDRRFQSRIASPSGGSSSSLLLSPRPSSPALLALSHASSHSRHTSAGSQFHLLEASGSGTDANVSPPWEVVRWTKLIKLSGQAFSESAKRSFGSPTCMAISTCIVLGTTKGILLLFDYSQNLKMIIGPGTRAVEAGAIISLAISSDHTTVAGGHADGSIFTWEISRASRPFLHIPPLQGKQAEPQHRTMDGHLHGFAVTHLGFLGTRRTALVSADDRGMAFAHLATRGTGSLGRTVKTSRILGRYPGTQPAATSTRAIKPSTVLAFAPLPLGNVDRATDTMGLTAMLTPYLLVIVSTTPVANTQHKSPRPKEIAPHSAMSGCLAWFPAVRLKVAEARTGSSISAAKLVYCWSNVLTVLDVEEETAEDQSKPPNLHCRARSRWKGEEAIVAVQWLTRSVLAVLTISQRLIVLEDHSMRVTEAFDLMSRFIYHADLFSRQIQGVVETLDETDTSMHGVVADAFYMSFKAYKGRLFLLGFSDVAIGALSNWADRLIALMEHGDYVGAIQLATVFYTGDADKLTIGLPEDTETRHAMVRERLMEIMAASLRHAFGQRRKKRWTTGTDAEADAEDRQQLQQLAEACFTACSSVGDQDFVFDDMFDRFEEAGVEGVFLETLERHILEQTLTTIPPTVVKAMVRHYVGKGLEGRLEEMICNMETATLDLDQVTTLCRQHGLYDALMYVWNQALGDFITPLVELLSLLVPDGDGGELEQDMHETNAVKMFPYLSYVLTGRVYPTGTAMDEQRQQLAKAEIYWFLFSGKSVVWPRGGSGPTSSVFRTQPNIAAEPSFPYLRMILQFDAPSLLSALNEAFEDPFLNDVPEKQPVNGAGEHLSEEQAFGRTVNRQYIVTILAEVMLGSAADFAATDTIYLDMFIARNLPKYPQYLLLPESTLMRVLSGLCGYPGSDLAEDAQLSAEYLLSVYHPPEMGQLLPQFKAAGFYRILKRTYRADRQYSRLLQTYFEDPDDRVGVFACISECLADSDGDHNNNSNSSSLVRRQGQEVRSVMREHLRELVELDAAEAARRLNEHAAELHGEALDAASDRHELQYGYLNAILEGGTSATKAGVSSLIERYVRLMCEFEPGHVSEYVGTMQTADLRLDELLPTMEQTGVIDAAVVLMAREGQVKEAMGRLVQQLHTLEAAVQGVLGEEVEARSESDGSNATVIQQDAAEDLMRALQKYTHVGIWLCQSQTKTTRKQGSSQAVDTKVDDDERHLSADERLWLDLIDTTVQITRNLSGRVAAEGGDEAEQKLVGLLRSLVQHTFTALLKTATASSSSSSSMTTNISFLRVLKAFLTRAAASSPSLADLRAVLGSIFAAYAYEEAILRLSNRLLERSLFVSVHRSVELRQRGWRARGSACEACGRRVWGPGVTSGGGGVGIYEAWEAKQAAEAQKRSEHKGVMLAGGGRGGGGGGGGSERNDGSDRDRKGKGKQLTDGDGGRGNEKPLSGGHKGQSQQMQQMQPDSQTDQSQPPDGRTAQADQNTQPLGPLVLFACRHIYHQACLDALQPTAQTGPDYRCPIDG
ncbi:golgi complex component [Grosmannia clavigera kw1407]|uniref:Golgi complex component n=1 Tax=Grosmannia clavigera (strain kw1407 / UAMH 11150) TaxID=655863 RepID=F0XAI6_GROCL|nr:golgi complex component [Grosmannia clavigera kw1407]EFX05861.1 golgi complex component [Grosmannia clavigera kw1407]